MNKAKCKNCGDTIESRYRHEFVTCKCYKEYTQATHDYMDKHYTLGAKTITLSGKPFTIYDYDYQGAYADPVYMDLVNNSHGFFLDGGQEYCRYGGNFDDIEWIKE